MNEDEAAPGAGGGAGDGRGEAPRDAAAREAGGAGEVSGQLTQHIASLRRYAMALTGTPHEAEDLVQDCLTRALSRAHQYQAGTNLRAWLFTIMHNVQINKINLARNKASHAPVEDVEARLALPAGQEKRVELREMARALRTLPEDQRRVLLMVGLEGMKYAEVAEVLQIPIGTVMSRLSRAREALRQKMATRGTAHLRRIK